MSFLRNMFRALSRTERRIALGAAILVAVGLAGLAYLFVQQRTVSVPARSGTYTEGMVGQPSSVNPVLASSEADQSLVRLVFADLERLTDKIEPSADGKTVYVRLKPDLAWSDGHLLTADDVVFTLQSIQDPTSRSPLAGLFEGVTAERKSALEIEFRVTNVLLANAVRSLEPLPKHIYGDVPPSNWRLSEYNLKPVGSGPYIFTANDTGTDGFVSLYRLNANPRYAGTPPYIQQIKVRFFRNANELLAAFNAGQLQGFGTTDPLLLDEIQRPYSLTRFTSPTVYAVFWNTTTNPALGPLEVRKALDLATDRAALLPAVKGYGQVATGPFPPALAEASGMQGATSTDPAAILQSAGWQKNAEGIWTKRIAEADVRLEFTVSVPDLRFLRETAEKLAARWREFGAVAHLKFLPPGDELTAAVTNRSYDGLLFGNTVRGEGDLYPFWHSSGRFAPGLNLAIYQNAQVDGLLERLRAEGNADARAAMKAQVATLITADAPAVFLFSTDDLFAASRNVRGVSADFLEKPADRLRQLPEWYVGTTRKLK